MMATFPIEYSKTPLPGHTGGVRADINVDTGGRFLGAAITQVGRVFGELGQQAKNAQDAMRLSVLNLEADQLYDTTAAALAQTKTQEEADKLLETFDGKAATLAAGDSVEVQQAYTIHHNNTITAKREALGKVAATGWAKDANDQFQYGLETAINRGDETSAYTILQKALATGVIGQSQFDADVADVPVNIAFAQARKMMDVDPQAAIDSLTAMQDLAPDQLDQRDKLLGMANRNLKVLGNQANKDLTDLFAAGTLTVAEVQQRRSLLDDTDYLNWTKIAKQRVDKPDNPIAEASLKSAAIDIWRGTTTREAFDKEVRASLASPTGINDQQYATVMSAADTQLRASQAEDIRRYTRRAADVILGQYAGLVQFDSLGNVSSVNLANLSGDDLETAKLRLHFLSKYEDEIRQMIADNPDISGKEFHQKAEALKQTYWYTPLEQIKAEAATARKAAGVYVEGDTKTINGTVWTYDGQKWHD